MSAYHLARIGTIKNRKEIVTRTSEQTACNFYEITVPARTEAVLYHEVMHGSYGGHLRFVFDGTCTDEHFVNRLFQYSEVAEKRSIGKPMQDWHRPYDYLLLQIMLGGEYEVKLDDGVTITAEVKNIGTDPYKHTAVYARIALDCPIYTREAS